MQLKQANQIWKPKWKTSGGGGGDSNTVPAANDGLVGKANVGGGGGGEDKRHWTKVGGSKGNILEMK